MKTAVEKRFKAVDFMREVREELSNLYNTDKEKYFEEIQKAMADFKAQRQENAFKKGNGSIGAEKVQQ